MALEVVPPWLLRQEGRLGGWKRFSLGKRNVFEPLADREDRPSFRNQFPGPLLKTFLCIYRGRFRTPQDPCSSHFESWMVLGGPVEVTLELLV